MAASSARIEPSTSLNLSFPTSFTDLLATDDYSGTSPATTVAKGLGDRIAERTGSGVPKFKSFPPPSLPISPPPVSPSSYFAFPPGLSPTMLLDSPVLLYGSNILPSPTTGTISGEAFKWKNDSDNFMKSFKQEEKYYSDFSFQSQSPIFESLAMKSPMGQVNHYMSMQDFNYQDGFFPEKNTENSNDNYQQSFSPETANLQNNSQPRSEIQPSNNHHKQPLQRTNEKIKSEDGYNWRKYGQKQVKKSANPRSYYKCTYPNCLTRKILEKSIDGHISQIVYKGNHNHPVPQSTRRSSNSSTVLHPYNVRPNDTMDHQSYGSGGNGQLDPATTQDNSSVSIGDGDYRQSPEISKSVGEEFDDDQESQAKRWKSDSQNEEISAPRCRTIREPRVVVQTTSEIDLLIDGFRWRKYGQKAVRGNPNPRSYYKCTNPGCPVRKHVERASDDHKSVITTYEGKHTHDIPAARGTTTGNSNSVNSNNINNNQNNIVFSNTVRPTSSANHPLPYTLQMLQTPPSEMYGYADS